MQLQSEKGYDSPKIGSFYEVNIPNSDPYRVHVGHEGAISIALGTHPDEINLAELLNKVPLLRKKKYWILENRWACVFYPDWDTPLFLNKAGKFFCLVCDGKNTFREILEVSLKTNTNHDSKKVVDDAIKFFFLLKRLKLITLKNPS
jgi:hypothetical protein